MKIEIKTLPLLLPSPLKQTVNFKEEAVGIKRKRKGE